MSESSPASPSQGIDVDVPWTEACAANRANWDDRAGVHEPVYGVEKFADPQYLSTVIRDDRPLLERCAGGLLAGKDVVHLQRWAQQIARLLRPGGFFFIRDGHPMLYAMDEDADPIVPRYRYFPSGRAQQWDSDVSYAGDGKIAHTRAYEFPHSLAEIFGVLLSAGLVIEHFDEGRTLPWQAVPCMERVDEDTYVFPGHLRDVIPCTFTIVARRP